MMLELARIRMERAYEAILRIADPALMFAGPERAEYDEARAEYLRHL